MVLNKETNGMPFLEKLNYVVENGEFDYWENRNNPSNLSVDEFCQVLCRIDEALNLKWIPRESSKGPYGRFGENYCFKFDCEIKFGGIIDIETKFYFVKGYFFDRDNLKGVTIQSFREE